MASTWLLRRIIRQKRRWVRAVQDYRLWHVPTRCSAVFGCDCPCGYCKHDRRHVPGRLMMGKGRDV